MGGVIFRTVGAGGFFPLQQHICILGGLRPSEIFKSEEMGLKTRQKKGCECENHKGPEKKRITSQAN